MGKRIAKHFTRNARNYRRLIGETPRQTIVAIAAQKMREKHGRNKPGGYNFDRDVLPCIQETMQELADGLWGLAFKPFTENTDSKYKQYLLCRDVFIYFQNETR